MTETLVADSTSSYIERAVNLAEDKELLINLRKSLRQQMKDSPLCDAESFAKNIEDVYLNIWEKYTGS
jgi:protein O-GlcNAc transferase